MEKAEKAKDITPTKRALPTIDLKGHSYVQVKDRVLFFNETCPKGRIHTEYTPTPKGGIIFKASVTPDVGNPDRYFIGHSYGVLINEKAMEKLETVSVGRALAFMGIGVLDSIASADEMQEYHNAPKPSIQAPSVPRTTQYAPLPPKPSKTEANASEVFDLPPCDICGNPLREKAGKFGKFFGCSAYPKCRKIVNPDQLAGYIKTWESQRPQNQAPLPDVAPPDFEDGKGAMPWENEEII